MFRYVALLWDAQDLQQADAAQAVTRRLKSSTSPWQEALDLPGLCVLCADAQSGSLRPQVLEGKAGIVLGSLFTLKLDTRDDSPSQPCNLGAGPTAAIIASRGEWLVRNCWGNYVAL